TNYIAIVIKFIYTIIPIAKIQLIRIIRTHFKLLYISYGKEAYKMKRIILLFSSLVLLVALAACGKSGEEAEADNNNDAAKSGKGDVIEAEVEDASYILAGDSGEGEDSGLLLINLNIKNVSDSSIDLFPENNMQLYDGDQQID